MSSSSSDQESPAPPQKRRRLNDADKRGNSLQEGMKSRLSTRNGHQYEGNRISRPARVHLGDEFNEINNYYQDSLDGRQKGEDMLIDSLYFDGMGDRDREVTVAHIDTCQWLFTLDQFVQWIDEKNASEHHGLLWIKGSPGVGKSTIIKTAFEWASKKWSDQVIISYFFHARASSQLQKSSLGLYRSLVYQILSAVPAAKVTFIKRFSWKIRTHPKKEWGKTELQDFLRDIVSMEGARINLFVDALDEGEGYDVEELIEYLGKLAQLSICSRLRIFLTSRNYPNLSIEKALTIHLEHQKEHYRDIERYVRSRLHWKGSPQIEDIRRKVCHKSQGVFLWVVLVVRMLKRSIDRAKSSEVIDQHLESIPLELSDLFSEILIKCDEDLEECFTLLQWTLFSIRPLTLAELYLAVNYSSLSSANKSIAVPKNISFLKEYLLDRSRGLVEMTNSDPPKIQFIHETVRDFLIKEGGLAKIKRDLSPNVEGLSHDRLRDVCLRYIKCRYLPIRELIIGEPCTSKTGSKTQAAKRKPEISFLEYSVSNLFRHADRAEEYDSSQAAFLENMETIQQDDFGTWVAARNDFEKRPIREYSKHVSILYVVVEQQLIHLVRLLVEDELKMNPNAERYGNVLQAACITGNVGITRILLDQGADVSAIGGEHDYALSAAIHRKHIDVVKLIATKKETRNNRMLGHALGTALRRNYVEGVELLLEMGANINDRVWTNKKAWETPLYWAASRRDHSMINLLLRKGADMCTPSSSLGSPLQLVSIRGYSDVMQIFMDQRTSTGTGNFQCGNELHLAAFYGHEQVIQILLSAGADVNAHATIKANTEVPNADSVQVKKLLAIAKSDSGATGTEKFTALFAASMRGHAKVVRILLDAGAGFSDGRSSNNLALQAACTSDHHRIVQMLLNAGADVNAQGGKYHTALHAASSLGEEKIVRILLDFPVNVNLQNSKHRTALEVAAAGGFENIVRILLEVGADVRSRGRALFQAITSGRIEVVKLLLDFGVDVKAAIGNFDPLAIGLFCEGKNTKKEIVGLLRDALARQHPETLVYKNRT